MKNLILVIPVLFCFLLGTSTTVIAQFNYDEERLCNGDFMSRILGQTETMCFEIEFLDATNIKITYANRSYNFPHPGDYYTFIGTKN